MRITESKLRRLIRSVILENIGGINRLPVNEVDEEGNPIKLDDDQLSDLASGIHNIFSSYIDIFEYPEDAEEELQELKEYIKYLGSEENKSRIYLKHLDETYLKAIEEKTKETFRLRKDNYDFTHHMTESNMAGYVIKKEAFKILGFSDADIAFICKHDPENTDDSYDYHSGVTVSDYPDRIEFQTNY